VPYIKKSQREFISATLQNSSLDLRAIGKLVLTSGELNYSITEICLGFLSELPKPGYEDYADVISTLECVKLEFYRRAVAPHEDKKRKENGDVYR